MAVFEEHVEEALRIVETVEDALHSAARREVEALSREQQKALASALLSVVRSFDTHVVAGGVVTSSLRVRRADPDGVYEALGGSAAATSVLDDMVERPSAIGTFIDGMMADQNVKRAHWLLSVVTAAFTAGQIATKVHDAFSSTSDPEASPAALVEKAAPTACFEPPGAVAPTPSTFLQKAGR